MTTAEFLKLDPREQDAIVAEKILGLKVSLVRGEWLETRETAEATTIYALNFYTRSIAAAWEVVEKAGQLTWHMWKTLDDKYFAQFGKDKDEFHFKHSAEADTPALAVCLAALKAVGFLE